VTTLRTQVLVVGSGAGGAVTAASLSAQGYQVMLLEEGPYEDTSRIVSNSTEAIARLYRNGGMTPILGKQSIAYVEGRCVGGSTEINSGFWHRLPPDCYPRWKTSALLDAFTPEVMEPYFERIERDLSVSYLSAAEVPKSSALFRDGIERLGWEYQEVPRCQSADLGGSAFAAGAKQSMQRTYIPRALAQGTQLVADCKAVRILRDGDRVRGIEAQIGANGSSSRVEILADTVFLSCGAIQTPALLRRSGIKKNVGDNLCIHPMIKAAALFDEEVEAHEAALPIYQVKEFWPTITIGGAVFTPGFLAMILSDSWRMYQDAMQDWSRMALYYASSRGMARGSIRVLPRLSDGVVIRYQLSQADRRNLSVGLAHLGEILFAAGARAVYPSLSGFPVLRSADQCRGFLENPIPIAAMGLSNVHAFSSCPMGENPDLCATDSFGRVHGLRNLHVNDASLIPDSPGVNPQGTTMAIAFRNADRFMESGVRSRPSRPAGAATSTAGDHADAQPTVAPSVIVTGAPGWLGTRLVEVLTRGFPDLPAYATPDPTRTVRCLVHPAADPTTLVALDERLQIATGDLTDRAALRELCRDAAGGTVFHVAGLVHPARRTAELEHVNVEGTRNLLAAAEEAGVRRVVVVSSNSPIGCNPHPEHVFDERSPYQPYMGYGRSKEKMEHLVAATQARGKLETVVIRPPWFYGPHQPPRQTLFFTMIKEGRFPVLGDGTQRRSMAYVDNICQGLLLAADTPSANGETYWIADEHPYAINEIVATVAEVLESEFRIPCARRQMRLPSLVGSVAWLADWAIQSTGFYEQKLHVLGEMNKTIACSIEKAKRDLGYRPCWALREGMVASIRWCLEHGQQI
jgi:nucleoside-diphosphate-sugar epimerase/choline dehydrogenase-like flavoprotein